MFILGGCYNIHILTILRHFGSSLGTRPMSYSTMGLSEEIIPRPEWALTHGAEGRIEWAIDWEAMRARAIIVLVKSN